MRFSFCLCAMFHFWNRVDVIREQLGKVFLNETSSKAPERSVRRSHSVNSYIWRNSVFCIQRDKNSSISISRKRLWKMESSYLFVSVRFIMKNKRNLWKQIEQPFMPSIVLCSSVMTILYARLFLLVQLCSHTFLFLSNVLIQIWLANVMNTWLES